MQTCKGHHFQPLAQLAAYIVMALLASTCSSVYGSQPQLLPGTKTQGWGLRLS